MGTRIGQEIKVFVIISVAAVMSWKIEYSNENTESPILCSVCASVCCCRQEKQPNNGSELKADCSQKNLTKIPDDLPNDTMKISLEGNLIEKIPDGSFLHFSSLQLLRLDDNRIKQIQKNAISNPSLIRLYLEGNLLSYLTAHTFSDLPSLEWLSLSNNLIQTVEWRTFANLVNLRALYLDGNSLSHLTAHTFSDLPRLDRLGFSNNPIQAVEWRTFANLPNLRVLTLCCVNNLKLFPNLTGTNQLREIILDRNAIAYIPENLCRDLHYLQTLDLHSNSISIIPKLSSCSTLMLINLANNKLTSLEGQLFRGLSRVLDLSLNSNYILRIPADAFIGLSILEYLDLNKNGIEYIHPNAFKPLKELKELYLAKNNLQDLPSDGLLNLLILDTTDNEHLEHFPSLKDLPNIEKIATEHAYHCCEYLSKEREKGHSTFLSGGNFNGSVIALHADVDVDGFFINPQQSGSISSSSQTYLSFEYMSPDYEFSSAPSSVLSSAFSMWSDYFMASYSSSGGFQWREPLCSPQPGPFMPCSDLFGSWFLRVGVWLVFLLALIGNGIVILVIIFSRTKIDVSRFLICNLACADFSMGIYLGFLAAVDAATLGVFRKYGIHWQLSAGCGTASFLAVFSSELSIYTLSVITLERFYAIKHALHLEKRLKLQRAIVIMCFGWMFALVMASLPLFGVNSYYKYAVCLPFDISTKGALAYVSGLMLLNVFAFVVIMACYISIYCAIQGSLAWNCNDSRVARRMSLLVFTDFICWAPIAIFGLTSAFKLKPISLHVAKILTIFVLPVNSCANPFLYTIFTKQFKKDCYMILRCVRSENIPLRQIPTQPTTAPDGSSSLRRSVSLLVFPSCCRTSSSASEGQDPVLPPRSHPRYIYKSEVHTHCRKAKFQSRLSPSAQHDEEGTSKGLFKNCICFVPFWKHQRFSKSHEDVSLKTLRESRAKTQRRHSIAEDVLFNGGEGPTIILTGDHYIKKHAKMQEPSSSKPDEYVLLDGRESSASDNITSSSSKLTIISVEVTKEYERTSKVQKRAVQYTNRPSNLRMDSSSLPKSKPDEESPTQLNSPSLALSDCSSPATISECWSPSCSPGLSPTYSPGLCPPQILITHPEGSPSSVSDDIATEKEVVELGESML